MVASGELAAPIVIGGTIWTPARWPRPYRETEAMADGSDAIADWPLLNALVNASSGASWVSIHHGGGVGIGRSIHAGQVSVADGSLLAAQKARARAGQRPVDGRAAPRGRRLRPRLVATPRLTECRYRWTRIDRFLCELAIIGEPGAGEVAASVLVDVDGDRIVARRARSRSARRRSRAEGRDDPWPRERPLARVP